MAPVSLADLVAEQVKRTPDAVAVIWDGEEERCCLRITYQELWQRGCQVSKELQKLAADNETVGVCAEPGINLPSALLGILQASCSYFPFGLDGLGFVRQSLQKLNIKYLLLDTFCFQRLGPLLVELQSSVIPSPALQALGFHLVHVQLSAGITEHVQPVFGLAYCITTSGTTGTPKIVRVPHSCIVPNVLDFRKEFLPAEGDITFLTSPLTFDPSVIDIFMTLTSGAALLLVATVVKMSPDHLLTMLTTRHRVTLLQITPSTFKRFNPEAVKRRLLGTDSSLRVLAFGGETFPQCSVFDNCMHPDNRTSLYNVYGITELSAWASIHCARPPNGPVQDAVPIGKPLTGTKVKVIDEQGKVLKSGTGHILIGGCMRTCLLDEEGEELLNSGGVWRRTGDLGMIDTDCNILCLGREDRQIKRHGKRLDLDTLQTVCKELEGVEDCCAVYSHSKLCMFIKIKESLEEEDSRRLYSIVRVHLLNVLPSQYQPDHIALLPDFPVNAHGKLDVPALLNKLHDKNSIKNQQQHLPTENLVRELWQDATGLKDVMPSPTDNFLLLGGDSLRAVQFVDSIESHLGHLVPDLLDTIFNKTWADLLSLLQQRASEKRTSDELQMADNSHLREHTSSEKTEDMSAEARMSQRSKHSRFKSMHMIGDPKEAMPMKGNQISKGKGVGDLIETVQPLPCFFRRGTALFEAKAPKRKDHHSQSDVGEKDVDVREPSAKMRKLNSPNLEMDLEISPHTHPSKENTNMDTFPYTYPVREGLADLPSNVLLCGRDENNSQFLLAQSNIKASEESCASEIVSSIVGLRSGAEEDSAQSKFPKPREQEILLSGSAVYKGITSFSTLEEQQKQNIHLVKDSMQNISADTISLSPEFKDDTVIFESKASGSYADFDVGDLFVSSVSRASSQLFTTPRTVLNCQNCACHTDCSPDENKESDSSCQQCGCHKNYLSYVHVSPKPSGSGSCSELIQKEGHTLQLKFQWAVNTGKCVDASPLAATTKCGKTVLFIGSHSHKFLAINIHSGDVVWSKKLADRVEGSACLSPCGRQVVVGCYDSNIYMLSTDTGEVTWQVKTGDVVKCSPVADSVSGLVFCGSHDGFLYALHCKDHRIQWKHYAGGGGVFASPVINPEGCAVYAATLGGYVTALDMMTGNTLWRVSLGKPVFSSPTVCIDRLYVGCVDSVMYCLSCVTGDQMWVYKTEASIFSSPVVTTSSSTNHHSILFGCHDKHLYCLSDSGQLVWKAETSSTVYASPFVFYSHGGVDCQQAGHYSDSLDCNCKRKQSGKMCVVDSYYNVKDCKKREVSEAEKSCVVKNEDAVQQPVEKLNESDMSAKFIQESFFETEISIVKPKATGLAYSGSHCSENLSLTTEANVESRTESENNDQTETHSKLVACASTKGTISVICCLRGEKVCSVTSPGDVFSSPIVVDNHLVVGCRDNNVYCYKLIFLEECKESSKDGDLD